MTLNPTPGDVRLALKEMLPRTLTLRFEVQEDENSFGEFSVDFHDGPYSVEYIRPDPAEPGTYQVNLLHYLWRPWNNEFIFTVTKTYPPEHLLQAVLEAVCLNTTHRLAKAINDKIDPFQGLEVSDGLED